MNQSMTLPTPTPSPQPADMVALEALESALQNFYPEAHVLDALRHILELEGEVLSICPSDKSVGPETLRSIVRVAFRYGATQAIHTASWNKSLGGTPPFSLASLHRP